MSGQAQISDSMTILSGNLNYRSNPTGFTDTINLANPANGPTPGTITVTVAGVDVSFAQLITPGYCWMQNLDANNGVEWGIRDTVTNVFYPVGYLKPAGPFTRVYFAPRLGQEESPGTGSHPPSGTTKLHMRALGGSCFVRVDAFEA